jgi:hypothetical protein
VTECVVKALHDVKVTNSKPEGTKNPAMLMVGVAQAGCDPLVILMRFLSHRLVQVPHVTDKLTKKNINSFIFFSIIYNVVYIMKI